MSCCRCNGRCWRLPFLRSVLGHLWDAHVVRVARVLSDPRNQTRIWRCTNPVGLFECWDCLVRCLQLHALIVVYILNLLHLEESWVIHTFCCQVAFSCTIDSRVPNPRSWCWSVRMLGSIIVSGIGMNELPLIGFVSKVPMASFVRWLVCPPWAKRLPILINSLKGLWFGVQFIYQLV